MNERRMAAQQRSNRRSSRRSSYSPPRGGGADMGTVSTPTRKANPVLVARAEAEQRQADETNRRIAANREARAMALTPPKRTIGGGINRILNNPFVRTYAAWGTGGISEKLRQAMLAKELYDTRNILGEEAIEEEVRNVPVTGGIGDIFSNLLGFSHAGAAELTKEDMDKLGFTYDDPWIGGPRFTDPIGEATQAYYDFATGHKAKYPQKDPGAIKSTALRFGETIDAPTKEQMGLLPEGFLATPEDYKIQKSPLELYTPKAEGGLINFFKNGGFLG